MFRNYLLLFVMYAFSVGTINGQMRNSIAAIESDPRSSNDVAENVLIGALAGGFGGGVAWFLLASDACDGIHNMTDEVSMSDEKMQENCESYQGTLDDFVLVGAVLGALYGLVTSSNAKSDALFYASKDKCAKIGLPQIQVNPTSRGATIQLLRINF